MIRMYATMSAMVITIFMAKLHNEIPPDPPLRKRGEDLVPFTKGGRTCHVYEGIHCKFQSAN
jgi:hypothetical protein